MRSLRRVVVDEKHLFCRYSDVLENILDKIENS